MHRNQSPHCLNCLLFIQSVWAGFLSRVTEMVNYYDLIERVQWEGKKGKAMWGHWKVLHKQVSYCSDTSPTALPLLTCSSCTPRTKPLYGFSFFLECSSPTHQLPPSPPSSLCPSVTYLAQPTRTPYLTLTPTLNSHCLAALFLFPYHHYFSCAIFTYLLYLLLFKGLLQEHRLHRGKNFCYFSSLI